MAQWFLWMTMTSLGLGEGEAMVTEERWRSSPKPATVVLTALAKRGWLGVAGQVLQGMMKDGEKLGKTRKKPWKNHGFVCRPTKKNVANQCKSAFLRWFRRLLWKCWDARPPLHGCRPCLNGERHFFGRPTFGKLDEMDLVNTLNRFK